MPASTGATDLRKHNKGGRKSAATLKREAMGLPDRYPTDPKISAAMVRKTNTKQQVYAGRASALASAQHNASIRAKLIATQKDAAKQMAAGILIAATEDAARVIVGLMHDDEVSGSVRLDAAKYVLEHAGLSPKQAQDDNSTSIWERDASELMAALDQLQRQRAALDATDAEIVEVSDSSDAA